MATRRKSAAENSGKNRGKTKGKGKPRGKPFRRGERPPVGRPFEPGVSANPGGRPKALKELKERIQRRGEDLVDALLAIAAGERGPIYEMPSHRERILAVKELMAYGYGRPVLAVEVSGPGGGAVGVRDVSDMNSTERRERLLELARKAGAGAAVAGAAIATAAAAAEDEDGEDDAGSGGT